MNVEIYAIDLDSVSTGSVEGMTAYRPGVRVAYHHRGIYHQLLVTTLQWWSATTVPPSINIQGMHRARGGVVDDYGCILTIGSSIV